MKYTVLIHIVILLCGLLPSALADTIVFQQNQANTFVANYQGTEDTYLSNTTPTTPQGATTPLQLTAGATPNRTLIRFDLAALAGKYNRITGVTLTFVRGGGTSGSGTVTLYPLSSPNVGWTAANSTWTYRVPSSSTGWGGSAGASTGGSASFGVDYYNNYPLASLAYDTATDVTGTAADYVFSGTPAELTSLAEQALASGTNAGFILTVTSGTGGPAYDSSEQTGTTGGGLVRAPKLTITYDPVTTQPTLPDVLLMKDINNQPQQNGASSPLLVLNGVAYFTGTTVAGGSTLWRSDGTEAGTYQLANVVTSALTKNGIVGSTLYFAGTTTANGRELWKTDGTVNGTVMVKDIKPGAASSIGSTDFAVVGTTLFFAADDGTNGTELRKSDGTSAGTVMVADLWTGTSGTSGLPNNGFPSTLTAFNGQVYFSANPGSFIATLFKSDGTAGGTVQVRTAATVPNSAANLKVINGKLFFSASDTTNGTELWKSDGTSAGTVLVKNIRAGSSNSSPGPFFDYNGTAIFSANDGNGDELWKSDGTSAGTVKVKEINPITSGSSFPSGFTLFNSLVYFQANDGTNGVELWSTDGTTAGTVLVKDINSGSGDSSPTLLTVSGTSLYFSATDGTNGIELWKSDGSTAGTVQIKEINTGTGSAGISEIFVDGNVAYFGAYDGVNGTELWRTDGTAAGTWMVKDINPGRFNSTPAGFMKLGSYIYFAATDDTHGRELWRTDGTTAGTELFQDIVVGSGGSGPSTVNVANGVLFFSAFQASTGRELWRTDGTPAGTYMLQDVNPGTGDSFVLGFNSIPYAGKLYFTATDATNGTELWRSDGTSSGTVLAANIDGSSSSSSPGGYVIYNGKLIFSATRTAEGTELWRYDEVNGAQLVKDINTGTASSSPSLELAGGILFIGAANSANGRELWKTDGTTAGTVFVKDLNPGAIDSTPAFFAANAGVSYFRATTSIFGSELWRTDGTTAGTYLVRDVTPGTGNGTFNQRLLYNGFVYFDGRGSNLMRTDGTFEGTRQVSGANTSNVNSLTQLGTHMLFYANVANESGELLRLNTPPVFSGITGIDGGTRNQPLPLTYAQLLAASSYTDAEGDAVSFRIGNVPAGTLLVNGQPVVAGTTLFQAGDTVTYTPPAGFSGTANAFQVTLFDGSNSTATQNVQLIINKPFDTWRKARFNTSELADLNISGPAADPDRDGQANAIEYVLLREPKDSASTGSISASLVTVRSPNSSTPRFLRISVTIE